MKLENNFKLNLIVAGVSLFLDQIPCSQAAPPEDSWKIRVAISEALAEGWPLTRLETLPPMKRLMEGYIGNKVSADLQQGWLSLESNPWFFSNLISQSQGMRRLGKNGNRASSFVKVSHLEQALRSGFSNKVLVLTQLLEESDPPLLTHPEVLKLLAAVPTNQQERIYAILAPSIFTQYESFPVNLVQDYTGKIDSKLLTQIREDSRESLFFPGYKYILAYRGNEKIRTPFHLRLLWKFVNTVQDLSIQDLCAIIQKTPTLPIPVNSDKDLLDLRDHLRTFSEKKWTASDLVQMQVPLNIPIVVSALDRLASMGASLDLVTSILESATAIWNSSGIQDISENPNKPGLANPKNRGINRQVIYDFILNKINTLKT